MDGVYSQHERRIGKHPTAATPHPRRRSAGRMATLLFAAIASAQACATPPQASANPDVLAALDNGLRPSTLQAGETLPAWSLQERMIFHKVPGVAIAILRDGKVVQTAGFGVRERGTQDAVNADTLFSVGSISKVVTAATTLRQVAAGRIDLDRNINGYLTSWQVPRASAFHSDALTLRMLMSHTSGLTVWGFEDFQPGETLPSIVQTLNGAKPAKNEPVRIDFEPGSRMRYSGGGVTVEQLVLQDITGKPLEALARNDVFAPIGMGRSTFANPLPATLGNIAKAHDQDGSLTALPRGWEAFPEQAASGLWTSANDLGAFVGALISAYKGRSDFLSQPLAVQMMTEVSPSIHGLGPRLEGDSESRIFHHGGSNDSYRAWIEGYLDSGDGMVILTNGSNGGKLMMEIRNAISDALGRGINPVVRAVTLAPQAMTDFAGTYRMDTRVPGDVAGNLAGYFETDMLEVSVTDGAMTVNQGTDEPPLKLQPLTPTRFIGGGDVSRVRFEFLRNAQGQVYAMVADRGSGRLYFRRDTAAVAMKQE